MKMKANGCRWVHDKGERKKQKGDAQITNYYAESGN